MCGGLVVLAPGSPYQILGAILIMLFHLLVVLKLAPFIKDSEDWSSFISTLGLCLTSLGAYSMLLKADKDELNVIGAVLVGISVLCITIVIAIMILIDCGLWKRLKGAKTDVTEESQTQIQPVNENNTILNIDETTQHTNEISLSNDFSTFSVAGDSRSSTQIQPVNQTKSGITRVRSATEAIVDNIHEEHRKSQLGLDANIQRRARKQKRKTELRVQARSRLKQTKALSKVEAFAILTEIETEAMIDVMTRESHLLGDILCQQGEIADRFYIVMNGECGAFVTDKNGYRQVGTIPMYGFFGESSLLSQPGVDDIRNATVEVMSDSASLLVLTKIKFCKLIEDGALSRDVLAGVKKVDLERQKQNTEVGEGGDKKNLESGEMKEV